MNKKIKEIEEARQLNSNFHMQWDDLSSEEQGRIVDYLLSHIKELENNIPDPEWCCTAHKAELVKRIKELEEEIAKHRLEQPIHFKEDLELYKLLKESDGQ